jgi:hypothetical protein
MELLLCVGSCKYQIEEEPLWAANSEHIVASSNPLLRNQKYEIDTHRLSSLIEAARGRSHRHAHTASLLSAQCFCRQRRSLKIHLAQSTFANITDLSVSSLDYIEFYRNCLKKLLVLPRCDIRRLTHYSIHVTVQHMQRPAL